MGYMSVHSVCEHLLHIYISVNIIIYCFKKKKQFVGFRFKIFILQVFTHKNS